jgi:3',5'-cyclic AMP phosphodiesterase CpdA
MLRPGEQPQRSERYPRAMRLVVISDTHGFHGQLVLPDGDVLVHTGDFCRHGTRDEYVDFLRWFAGQPHPHKLLIAGNHDMAVERDLDEFRAALPAGVTYLHDSGTVVDGVRFWGSPWTPIFYDWSFMLPRGEMLREKWAAIPDDTEVLLTHGPAYGHGDLAPPHLSRHRKVVGCLELLLAIKRVRPRLHLFGHIHGGHGVSLSDEVPFTRFVNAAICTEGYEPTNAPVVVDL